MKTITASEFKAKCLQVMDEVAETGEAVVIAKRGKAVARLVPVASKSLIGLHEGQIEILGDIISPIYEEWARDLRSS